MERNFFDENNDLRGFLDAGALEKLLQIKAMEEYRRALDTTQVKTTQTQTSSDFFTDYYRRGDLAWDNITRLGGVWRDRLSEGRILSPYEIPSFEKEYLLNVHSWLSSLKYNKDPLNFDEINKLATNLNKLVGELKKVCLVKEFQ